MTTARCDRRTAFTETLHAAELMESRAEPAVITRAP